MSPERSRVCLSPETVRRWIDVCKDRSNRNLRDYYIANIGIALENKDPVALDFLARAAKEDPDFVEASQFRFIHQQLNGKK